MSARALPSAVDLAEWKRQGEVSRAVLAETRREWQASGLSWQAFSRLKAGDKRVLRSGLETDGEDQDL